MGRPNKSAPADNGILTGKRIEWGSGELVGRKRPVPQAVTGLPAKVKNLRMSKNLTFKDLAQKARVSIICLQKIEQGRLPSVPVLWQLSQALQTPVEDFFNGRG